jgi:opacity protein-like surface antigen
MRKTGFIILALLLFAGLASAQIPTSGNVFFGYSYENASSSALGFDSTSRANLNGWEASLEGKVFPWIGIVADFGGHYGSQNFQFSSIGSGGASSTVDVDGHELTVLFGPRVSVPIGRFRPFAEALFGFAQIDTSQDFSTNLGQPSDNSFATALGGGIDYRIIKPVAWRFQGDYVQTRFFGTTQNNVRLSTGIVFRF